MAAHDATAEAWRRTARITLETAKQLRDCNDPRSCVSRAYYAAYQAATSIGIAHGDAKSFGRGRNNPTHEQLPELIGNNGSIAKHTRGVVQKMVYQLRELRATADYRVGWTVDERTAADALVMAESVFERLNV